MPVEAHAESVTLRTALRELVALSTMPAAWLGREPHTIAAGLADLLVRSLHMEFVFVRLCDPNGGAAIELMRGHAWKAFPEWLQTHVGRVGHLSCKEIVPDLGGAEAGRGVVIPIGVNAQGGLVAAACTRSDFPSEIDQLLLSVAANHAATAFQDTRLRNDLSARVEELRQARNELEAKVAQRTAKLTTANEELHRQREQLDRLFELSPVAVILTDQNLKILRVSQEFTLMFGYPPEEAVGHPLYELIVPEEFQEDTLKNMALVVSGERLNLESVRQRKDGVRLDVSITVAPLSLGSGQEAVYHIYRDITEHKKAERKLRRSEANLLESQRLVHMCSWAYDPSSGMVTFSPEMKRIYDTKSDQDIWTADFFLDRLHPEDRPVVEEIFRRAQLDKTDCDASYRIVLPDGSIKHIFSVGHPVLNQSGELVEFVGTSMDLTEQWKARTELEKAFEEIKQRTEAARRSERELRDVVNTVPAYVWSTSPEGHVDFVNDRWLQFTGLALDEAFGWSWEAVVHPDDRTRVVADWHTALKNGRAMESEARVRRADGEYCWWFTRNVPLRDETGKLVRWYGTAIDIEDRKRAEQALRKSEERWRSVFENSAIGVALTDLNGRFLATNHVYQTIVGYTEEELRALCFLDVTHEDYREANWALVTELLEGKRRQFQIEKKYLRKDGSSIWVSNNVSLVPGTETVPRFIMALSEDITQRKRAEEALQRSEGYLAEAQKLTHTGSWAWNVRTGVLFWSREIFSIYDYEYQEMGPTWPQFLERVHPEDRPQIEQSARMEASGKEWLDSQNDFRIILPNGTIKHLHSVAHPVRDESGEITEVVGTVMDVTEQWKARAELEKAFEEIKQRTEALRRSEAYLAEAQKLTHTGSWAVRVPQMENAQGETGQGRALLPRFGWNSSYWSKEMYRIFGLDPDPTPPSFMEVVRRLHPEDAGYYTPVVEQAIRDRTDFETDYRLLLPNGAAKYIHVVGHPVVNASGDVLELVGTAMDVTEQHEARAALQTAFEQIKAEETELRRMTDAIASYIYVLRPDGTALYANQTVLDYTGLTLEDVQRGDHRARVFHPEDVERLREERNEALARGKPFELEQRALGKDGNYRWFLIRYNPLRDDHGNIIRWYATGTDIEDRKRAEERMRNENLALREQIDQAFMFEEIVGASPALQCVLSSIVKVAPTDSTVLITGETGTGKELIARAIHKHSQRSGQAFISVNCASIPSSLIASELFGHEKGAFTGAVQRRQGRFELAHSGTIFLDEVGELPVETQIALLRVLQERQFERVGGNRILPTDVRVIAATNRDLTAAIAGGTFRADLFYRLNVFPIEMPPLRKRKEDIPMLVEYFVKRYAEKTGKQIRKIDNNTLELCQLYPWPGNIRELQNIVERSVILCGGDTFWIEEAWLARVQPPRQELAGPLPDALKNQEKEIIEAALAESKGRVAGPEGAAAKLGIPRSTLDSKIKQLNIKKHKFMAEP
jgi:PAS domain S-box-containing protein